MNQGMNNISELLSKPEILEHSTVQFKQQQFDIDEIWKIVKEQLRLYVSDASIKAWYNNVYLSNMDSGIAEISCDNQYKREWIDTNNRNILKRILLNTTGQSFDIVVTIKSSFATDTTNIVKQDKYSYYNPADQKEQNESLFNNNNQTDISHNSNSAQNSTTNQRGISGVSAKSSNYTFDTFLVGEGNQFAHAVGEAVADAPGTAYNPVFYYGGTGVGKTHLMLAIAHRVLEKDPTKKIVYSPIENFLNEMINAIRQKQTDAFRKKYRDIDILILDDIQLIGEFAKTQDEVFNTFNALYLANKQIIMASDRAPKDIQKLTDRLRSRFEGGMVIDIQPPDLETRMAIIKNKIEQSGADISDEIIDFLAQNINSNIRELEGAITKVISITKYSKRLPEIFELEKMLQIDLDSKRKKMTPEKIIGVVSEVFEVNIKEITGKLRTDEIATARQVVMFLLREELKLPLEKTASEVNRKDHTTVIHACEKVKNLITDKTEFRNKVDLCKRKLRE
jgi:chromosomal replication initiator protein